ncbi:MAG: TlpA disulfide reductase family protein [Planctomycetota bacterium]
MLQHELKAALSIKLIGELSAVFHPPSEFRFAMRAPLTCLTLRAFNGLLSILILCGSAVSQDFFVEPVTTELQRSNWGGNVDLVGFVNCNALLDGTEFRPGGFDSASFRKSLRDLGSTDSSLILNCVFQLTDGLERTTRERVKSTVRELCQAEGLLSVRINESLTSSEWKVVSPADRDPLGTKPSPVEPIIRGELVHVSPIRTRLSKLKYGDVDCIVKVLKPIDSDTGELSEEFRSCVRECVTKARLNRTQTMLFDLMSTQGGVKNLERLFEMRRRPSVSKDASPAIKRFLQEQVDGFRPSAALLLAEDLGFEAIRYRHSPGGGSPEELVDRHAPDFDVVGLSGTKDKRSALMKNRPGLVTFWGLACGPCRQEALWLTRYHEEYSDQGFVIIAVNGYDDTAEKVKTYMDSQNLTHQISLNGSSVAKSYKVGAYPTSFWIDRSGTVVDYEVGFESEDRLRRRIEAILSK